MCNKTRLCELKREENITTEEYQYLSSDKRGEPSIQLNFKTYLVYI